MTGHNLGTHTGRQDAGVHPAVTDLSLTAIRHLLDAYLTAQGGYPASRVGHHVLQAHRTVQTLHEHLTRRTAP